MNTGLVPTNVEGYSTFELPPNSFNPLRASIDELHWYGLPHRPDPKKLPKSARHWQHIMGKIKKFVTPRLKVLPNIVHGPAQKLRALADSSKTVFGGSNWSGLVVTDAPPYKQVWGTWVVSAVQSPPGKLGSFSCGAWVGLGGFNNPSDPNGLLQAGTAMDAVALEWPPGVTTPGYSTWVEWFPGPTVDIEALEVMDLFPGHTIAVSVAHNDSGTAGVCTMVNLTTGYAITPLHIAAPTIDLFGNPITPAISGPPSLSAEWIVERPANVQAGSTAQTELCDYGELNMTNAGALSGQGAKGEVIAGASDTKAITVAMLADDNVTVLSTGSVEPAVHFTFEQTAGDDTNLPVQSSSS